MPGMALAEFLALACIAAYIQTMTGFAFGLVMMGGIGLAGLLPLPDAAVVVGALTLANAGQMLLKGWRDVVWREFGIVMAGSIPLLIAGYSLLGWLAETRIDALRLILGLVIVLSSLQLARRPQPLPEKSGDGSFLFFGALSGVMGGLFSTGGPPLVYHLYRQPWPIARIRETLVTVFALNQVFRLSFVALSGRIPGGAMISGLFALPIVVGATHAARRWPPAMSQANMRRIVFALLLLSGLSLAAPAAIHLFGVSL